MAQLGRGPGKDHGKAKMSVVEPNTGEGALQKHSTCPLAPKWDSQKGVIALGLKAASKITFSNRRAIGRDCFLNHLGL